ncbi:MAG: TonB-dependent receptor [Bacteroidales bacterium]|nr:TonB-dependent receptor [Bacteroidales bacterium]
MRKNLLLMFIGLVSFSFAQEVKDTSSINPSNLPTINLSTDEIDTEDDAEVSNVSSLLQGSKDVFVNTAGYTFGAARFKMRGYDTDQSELFMNGVQVNDIESGKIFYSTWGGLNDMMRDKEYINGLEQSSFAFGGVGGSNYITTRASSYRKNIGASYAISNRTYRNRFMLSYASGLMKNGWAVAVSGSKRWAQEGYQEGTFYDAYGYFLSVEKQFNKKHSIGLTAFGAPSRRGKAGGSVQEAYDLTNNNYYNPNWGYQDGEKRNSKVADSHKPHAILSYYFTPTDKTSITASASYAFGYYGNTSLNWYNTRDPRPDYYRYLPSYYDDPTAAAAAQEAFLNNSQLDWNYYYQVNAWNGNGRASYIVENRKTDYSEIKGNIFVNHKLNDHYTFDGGASYNNYTGRHYVVVDDLLGAEYYLDIDKFGERDFPNDPNMYDYDLNNPNKIRHVGDVISYDYDIHQIDYKGWAQIGAKLDHLDYFLAANLSQTTFWRTGHMKNGKFPDNSYGDSEKQNFLNYGVKGGATYKINGRNYIYANGYYGTKAPLTDNAFISPRTRDFVVDDLKSETIYSVEGGYHLRAPKIKARLSAYYTKFQDQTEVYSFYNDLYSTFTNQVLSGMDKQNIGIEFGAEGKINASFSATAVVALSQHTYTNRPTGLQFEENDASQLADPFTIYQKNFYQAGPQNAYSLGIKYNNPHFWFVTLTANYYQKNYLEINPARRTIPAVSNETGSDHIEEGSVVWHKIIDQEHLDDAFTLDLFFRKTWKIKGYYIYLNAGVNNILNNQDFITGGYEQRRNTYINESNTAADVNPDKFPPKYFYAYGINYFISLGFWY